MMSFGNAKWVWINGTITPWDKAVFHASVHALHYGSGVFEGIRCYETDDGPALFRIDAHLERFVRSAAVYDMHIPYTSQELTEAVAELVNANGFTSCYIRPLCFRGSGDLKVDPEDCPVEVAILAWPWAPLHGAASSKTGLRVCISRRRKFHKDMMPPTAKASGQYVNSILAIREAKAQGYDEPILLNTEGYLAEAASENIFLVRNNTVFTNDEQDSILLGITRLSVMEIIRDLGYELRVTRLSIDDLMNADEAFVTGTAAEVVPIVQVDGKTIGDGRCGPIGLQVQEEYMRAVYGRHPAYTHWLHAVKSPVAVQL
jgi:branched-chain amino acid aminotransferase